MTERSYRVRLEANVVGFVAQITGAGVGALTKLEAAAAKAGRSIDKIGDAAVGVGPKIDRGVGKSVRTFDDLAKRIDKNHQALNTIGTDATRMGLVAAAGIGLAAKAAIDWESAWAGVTKTVDGTTQQMADLEGELRGMAKTLPESHDQIAAVAEASGQLGVRREDIASFTKVMVDLGETTNLTSDEAATSLAQFMNVMQTAPQDVGRLGAAVVALGNDGASTERDIVQMAQRISGSGKIIGLSETQVLGYASALANVGIEAEAGGSAISTIFTKIDQAVSQGGAHLQNFATVSGETSAQFKQHFEKDAAGATLAFIQGIGAINDAGQDVNGTLETLGITEIRQRDAVLRLAASGTNLADSLKVSADGWRDNTALVDEAAKRYATTESQITIAWNNIKDAAITAGTTMLPVIAGIVSSVADLAKWFGDLPAPVRNTASALTAIVAVGGLVAGAGIKMVTSLAATRVAMTDLGLSSARASTALSLIGKASIALGLAAIAAEINKIVDVTKEMDLGGLTGDVLRFGETGKATGELLKNFGDDFGGLSKKFRSDGMSMGDALAEVGREASSNFEAFEAWIDGGSEASRRIHEIDQALAALVEGGNADSAAKAFGRLEEMARAQNVSLATLQEIFPSYGAAVESAGIDAQIAGEKTGGAAGPTKSLGEALGGTADSAENAATKLKDYIDALFKVPGLVLGVRDAQRGVQAAIDDATASIKENGRTLDQGTEKGRANQASLDQIADRANTLSEAYLNSNASQKTMTQDAVAARKAFVDTAVAMKMPKDAAQALAEQLIKIPDKKATEVSNNAGPGGKPSKDAAGYVEILNQMNQTFPSTLTNNAPAATAKVNPYLAALGLVPRTVPSVVTNTAPAAQKRIQDYHTVLGLTPPTKSTTVSTPGATGAAGSVENLLGLLGNLPPSKTVTVTTRYVTVGTPAQKQRADTKGHTPTNADGGYYPRGMYPSYADGKLPSQATIAPGKGGGMVQWAEGETGGEAFIPLSPSKRGRSTEILTQVADAFGFGLVRSFASGGFLPGGKLVDIAMILRQLGLPFNPTAGINYSGSLAALNKANAAAAPAKSKAIKADAAEQAAKAEQARIARAITLQQRYIKSLREEKPTSKAGKARQDAKIKAEQKELIGLQDQLYKAKNRVAAATKASNVADAAYKTKAEAAAKAAEAYKNAVEKLVEQQKAAFDLAQQISTGLTGNANVGDLFAKSLTGKGLLADLQQKGADLAKFKGLIEQLRKANVDDSLIQQIIAAGAGQGSQIAQAILGGGLAMVNALNKAQWELEKQANLIGAGEASSQFGIPVAGARAGGGPVHAGQTYRVNEKGQEFFTAPIDGYVIPNAVDPNRYIRSMGGDRTGGTSSMSKEVHIHQTLQFHGVSMAEADLIAQRANAKAELMNRGY